MEVKLLPVSSRIYRISDIISGGVFKDHERDICMKLAEVDDKYNAVSIRTGQLYRFYEDAELTKVKGSFEER